VDKVEGRIRDGREVAPVRVCGRWIKSKGGYAKPGDLTENDGPLSFPTQLESGSLRYRPGTNPEPEATKKRLPDPCWTGDETKRKPSIVDAL
jgi:hypothetical protein